MTSLNATITNYNLLTVPELRAAHRNYPTGQMTTYGNKKDLILRLCNADIARAKARLEELTKEGAEEIDWLSRDEQYEKVFAQWLKEAHELMEEMEKFKMDCHANKKLKTEVYTRTGQGQSRNVEFEVDRQFH